MTRHVERAILTTLLTSLVGGLLVLSLDLSAVARLAPLAVGVPTFCLLCRELVMDVFRPATEGDDRRDGEALSPGRMFGWLAFLIGSAFVAGLAAGLSCFVLAFLRVRSKERWPVALALAAGLWLVLRLGLEHLLRVNLYDGVLGGWIR
jgi:hypothetical protein